MRISDCSSDVCSSDLLRLPHSRRGAENQGFSGLLGGDAQEPEVGEGNDEVGAYHQDAVGRDRLPGLRLLQGLGHDGNRGPARSEEHTSELQSLMRISYAVFCSKKNTHKSLTLRAP